MRNGLFDQLCDSLELQSFSLETNSDTPPDIVEWSEKFIILPSGEFICFEKHQKAILQHVFKFGKDGKLPYSVIVYSCPKKGGKTALNALVMGYWAFNIEAPNEIICAANKKDQAVARGFKELRFYIQKNSALKNEVVRITERNIELKNGTTIIAIPNDFAGEAGSNHGLTTWDELWGFVTERDRRLYDELTPVPTRKNSIRFITTYAGFEGESELLEDLYHGIFNDNGTVKKGIKRPLGNSFPAYAKDELFVYWDHEPRMPWQTPEYYQSQRQQLRTNNYIRLHENRWVSSESGLFNMDRWDDCVDAKHSPPLSNKSISLYVGVDASTKRDRSAAVSVYREGDKIKLGPKRFWQPSPDDPMDLEETIEKYLLELSQGYTLLSVKYDPFQFHRSATTLKKKRLPMEEFPQTSSNLTEMGQNIYDLVEYGNIVLYNCKELRFEASCSIVQENTRGLKIVKDKSTQKIDQIIALAMAALSANKVRYGLIPQFNESRNVTERIN
jgi:phage terminase large subunit-like protein